MPHERDPVAELRFEADPDPLHAAFPLHDPGFQLKPAPAGEQAGNNPVHAAESIDGLLSAWHLTFRRYSDRSCQPCLLAREEAWRRATHPRPLRRAARSGAL